MIGLYDLSVTYPNGKAALKRTTIAFARGEFVVLLGPSGAGKSTLLRSLNGLVRPTTGHIVADGIGHVASTAQLRDHRRRTAFVFQQHQLIGRLSALRNVLMGRLGYHSTLRSLLPLPPSDQHLALECLERVGLADRALDRVDTLSGGQQQRVGLARALAQQPRLMLADEPVASLDPATARHSLQLLHGICKSEAITAVVSLHQVDLALSFADRIVGVARGAIVYDGPAGDLTETDLDRIYADSPVGENRGEHVAPASLTPLTAEASA